MLLNTKLKLIFTLLFVLMVVGNIVSIFYIVASGGRISSVNSQILEISQANQETRDGLVQKSSYTKLSEHAVENGYSKATNKLYISGNDNVAAAR